MFLMWCRISIMFCTFFHHLRFLQPSKILVSLSCRQKRTGIGGKDRGRILAGWRKAGGWEIKNKGQVRTEVEKTGTRMRLCATHKSLIKQDGLQSGNIFFISISFANTLRNLEIKI